MLEFSLMNMVKEYIKTSSHQETIQKFPKQGNVCEIHMISKMKH